MITIEEKLNTFSKLVFEKEQKRADEKLKNIFDMNYKSIEEHKKEIEKKCKEIVDKKIKEGNMKKNEMVSKASLDARNKTLVKKRLMLKTLIDEVEDKAKIFVESSEYKSFLLNKLSEILSDVNKDDVLSIYLAEKDIDRFKKDVLQLIEYSVLDIHKIDIIPMDKDIVGGILMVNHKRGIQIDNTIKTMIEDNKDLIGRLLYECLEEAGDING